MAFLMFGSPPLGQLPKQIFGQSWDFVPKTNYCLFCILGYSKHIILFMKKVPFLVIGDFLVGTREPHHIAAKSQQNHLFVWLWFWFEKVEIGTDPCPPLWDKIPTLTENLFLGLP